MFIRTLVIAFLTLTLTACNISGSGQKGPFKTGSTVASSELDNQALAIASTTISTQVKDNQGHFLIDQIPWNGWTEIVVSGQYFDEFNNADSDQALTLKTITRKDRRFDTANVHLYSHLAAARIRYRVAKGQNISDAWKETQTEMSQAFGLGKVTRNYNQGVEQLSLIQGSGLYKKDNANLLLFTGGFLAIGGDSAMLDALTNDFADDAEFKGDGASAFNAITSAAAATGLLQTLSQNLISNGTNNPPNEKDMLQLPVWVNTDVGETDTTPPAITILGDNPVHLTVGDSYDDLGATAADDVDEAVNVTVTSNDVNTAVAGNYSVVYTATDSSNNSSFATREVNVSAAPDTTAPIITILGSNPVQLIVGDNYSDEGATATDDVDGKISVTITSNDVNTNAIGNYSVVYTATDASNNSSTATREVNVSAAPEITSVSGILMDSDLTPIQAIINVFKDNTFQYQTISDATTGEYSLTLDAASNYILVVDQFGYATQVKSIKTLNVPEITINIILVKLGTIIEGYNPVVATTLTGTSGTSVELDANSFDDISAGDTIDISITPLDTSSQDGLDAIPGGSVGQFTEPDILSPTFFLGMAEFKFTKPITGDPVNLSSGQTATITIPLFSLAKGDGSLLSVDDTLPLLYLDENTGIWIQEGEATVIVDLDSPTGFAAQGIVSHFSWWGLSISSPSTAFANISVTGSAATDYAQIKARTDADVSFQPDVATLNFGASETVSFPGWEGTETCFWAEMHRTTAGGSISVETTPEQCISPTPDSTYDLEFRVPLAGTILDAANNTLWEDSVFVSNNPRDFAGANSYCTELISAGYSDWRLPYSFEYSASSAIILQAQYNNTTVDGNWYWAIEFTDGDAAVTSDSFEAIINGVPTTIEPYKGYFTDKPVTDLYGVRCVRDSF